MVSSWVMKDLLTETPVPPSEAVKETVRLAQQLAAREKRSSPADFDFLHALLKQCRLFSRLDTLFKYAGASPKVLRHHDRICRRQAPVSPQGTSPLFKDAAHHASVAYQQHPSGSATIQVEHLLMALIDSDDSVVKAVFQACPALTLASVRQAVEQLEKTAVTRLFLYSVREIAEVVVVVLVLVVVIKQGLGEFRLIPSESMVPTLQVDDRIVVEKVTHWFRKPQRGDILVFYPPYPKCILRNDPWSVFLRLTGFSGLIYNKDSKIDTAFIKRTIGLPGDLLEVRPDEGVYINGQRLHEPYVNEIAHSYTVVRVPPKHYFMMGDNRNQSEDSRRWGFLHEDRIIGRAVFRFFPLDSRLGPLETR